MSRTILALVLFASCGDDGGSSPQDALDETSCTGNCARTEVAATFTTSATLNLAWYGVSSAYNTLYLEVDLGGSSTCPEENSPTPTYSLVMGAVPLPLTPTPVFSGGAMLDYSTQGDLLGGPPVAQADSITLTPDRSNGPPTTADAKLAFDIIGTFPSGTISGHLYATHCASMDE